MAVIEISDLHVRRGDSEVLHGLSLEIEAGKVTGLLGPSGSGKTTLMRAIVGVQVIASGDVLMLGEPAGAAVIRGRVGYMTQARGLYDDLSARDNVRYFARILKAPRGSVDEALATVRLGDLADRVVRTLSGGEQARTALATVLVAQAGYCDELLLLREGEVLARGTPNELRERTGTADLSEAFVRLIEHARAPDRPVTPTSG
jgi:ABC-2 type transport system ATP-binding protein